MFKITLNDLNSAICKLLCLRAGNIASDASDVIFCSIVGQEMVHYTTA